MTVIFPLFPIAQAMVTQPAERQSHTVREREPMPPSAGDQMGSGRIQPRLTGRSRLPSQSASARTIYGKFLKHRLVSNPHRESAPFCCPWCPVHPVTLEQCRPQWSVPVRQPLGQEVILIVDSNISSMGKILRAGVPERPLINMGVIRPTPSPGTEFAVFVFQYVASSFSYCSSYFFPAGNSHILAPRECLTAAVGAPGMISAGIPFIPS